MIDEIKTTVKSKFYNAEYSRFYGNIFPSKKEFKKIMGSLVVSCKDCGIYYWKNCRKRCNCQTNLIK